MFCVVRKARHIAKSEEVYTIRSGPLPRSGPDQPAEELMTDQLGKLAVALIVVLIIPACAILSPSASDLASTATATASPVATATATRTPTQTPPPTLTPTPTITPTATPLPFVVELRDNGTTLVTAPVYGYLFVLPTGWEVTRTWLDASAESRISASNEGITSASTTFSVEIDTAARNLASHLERRVNLYDNGFGFTIHRQGQMTNSRGTALAYVEYSGTFGQAQIHEYEIYFVSTAGRVTFDFHDSLDSAWYAVNMIQDSIQLIEP